MTQPTRIDNFKRVYSRQQLHDILCIRAPLETLPNSALISSYKIAKGKTPYIGELCPLVPNRKQYFEMLSKGLVLDNVLVKRLQDLPDELLPKFMNNIGYEESAQLIDKTLFMFVKKKINGVYDLTKREKIFKLIQQSYYLAPNIAGDEENVIISFPKNTVSVNEATIKDMVSFFDKGLNITILNVRNEEEVNKWVELYQGSEVKERPDEDLIGSIEQETVMVSESQ